MIKSRNLKKGEQMTLETKITKIDSAVKELVTQQEKKRLYIWQMR